MWRLCVLALVATASAQIPSLGWCPDFQPMANFNMNRYLGTWYEAERYFTVSELGTRCVTTNYIATPEGRIIVSNEITNSLTGLKRVMEGALQMVGREGEGRVMVKYSSLPLPYESEFSILDTDYDNYAVMWSCSGIGPVHTQNTWLLTRDRLPSLNIMQGAYNVLDKYKISRTFFVKTNQADCTILPDPAASPVERSGDGIVEESKSIVVPEVVVEDEQKNQVKPVVKPVVPVKPEVPQERTANPVPEEAKPMKVPELIMSESDKKDEKKDKPEEPMKDMPEKKKDMPEKIKESPEKIKDIPEKIKDIPEKIKDVPEKKKDVPEKKKDIPERKKEPEMPLKPVQ